MQKTIDKTREAVRGLDTVRALICDIRRKCMGLPDEGLQKSLKDAYNSTTEAQYRLLDAVTSMEEAALDGDPP